MTACAVCNAPPPLMLTRQGLRCGPCMIKENATLRDWLKVFVDLHVRDGNELGEMTRRAYQVLHGKPFEP